MPGRTGTPGRQLPGQTARPPPAGTARPSPESGPPAQTSGTPRTRPHRPGGTGARPPAVRAWEMSVPALSAPAKVQKSILACGSVVAVQNSVTLPRRMWLTFATGTSIDLVPREADNVHSATGRSSLASTSWTSSQNGARSRCPWPDWALGGVHLTGFLLWLSWPVLQSTDLTQGRVSRSSCHLHTFSFASACAPVAVLCGRVEARRAAGWRPRRRSLQGGHGGGQMNLEDFERRGGKDHARFVTQVRDVSGDEAYGLTIDSARTQDTLVREAEELRAEHPRAMWTVAGLEKVADLLKAAAAVTSAREQRTRRG